MKILRTVVVVAALTPSLGACSHKPEIIDTTAPDPMASQLANAAPIELPPSITASVSFRCRDNSLVYVDFFKGGELANLRTETGGMPIQLKAVQANKPLTGSGYSIAGDAHKITLTEPGKESIACTA